MYVCMCVCSYLFEGVANRLRVFQPRVRRYLLPLNTHSNSSALWTLLGAMQYAHTHLASLCSLRLSMLAASPNSQGNFSTTQQINLSPHSPSLEHYHHSDATY